MRCEPPTNKADSTKLQMTKSTTIRKKSTPSPHSRSQAKQKLFKRNRTVVTEAELGSPIKSPEKKKSRSNTPPPQADGIYGFTYKSPAKVHKKVVLDENEVVPRLSFRDRMSKYVRKSDQVDQQDSVATQDRDDLMSPLIQNKQHSYYTRSSKKTQSTLFESVTEIDDEIHVKTHTITQTDIETISPSESYVGVQMVIDEESEYVNDQKVSEEIVVTKTKSNGQQYDLDLSDLCTQEADESLLWVNEAHKQVNDKIPGDRVLNSAQIAGKITLVLDLDECLVHSETIKSHFDHYDHNFKVEFNKKDFDVYFKLRPGLVNFLNKVNQIFEVVIFTASQKIYADKVLDLVDPQNLLTNHRLYRDSCVFVNGVFVKDLRILGRDLSKVIIVDNAIEAFAFQIDNGVPIKTWLDNDKDSELSKLLDMLVDLSNFVQLNPHYDVRGFLASEFNMAKRIEAAVQERISI